MSTPSTSEVEETLRRLKEHKGVIGVVIVNQDGIPIRTTLDQADTVKYAGLITQLCSKARSAVRELDPQVIALTFLKKYLCCDENCAPLYLFFPSMCVDLTAIILSRCL
jgi:dynein light chain roadblock-type